MTPRVIKLWWVWLLAALFCYMLACKTIGFQDRYEVRSEGVRFGTTILAGGEMIHDRGHKGLFGGARYSISGGGLTIITATESKTFPMRRHAWGFAVLGADGIAAEYHRDWLYWPGYLRF